MATNLIEISRAQRTRTVRGPTVLPSLRDRPNVAIIGASGGIGTAISEYLEDFAHPGSLHRYSRVGSIQSVSLAMDILDEDSVEDSARKLASEEPLDLVIVATGLLHNDIGLRPEKRLSQLETENLARLFEVNAIGPAIVAKHFLPLLRRDGKSVFAALSARVGSITDNRLGGWASYRASKAALNMLIKTAAIEHARSCPDSVVVSLHPGTVDTRLSSPFQGNIEEQQLFSPARAASQLVHVIDRLNATDTGGFFSWDGKRIDF